MVKLTYVQQGQEEKLDQGWKGEKKKSEHSMNRIHAGGRHHGWFYFHTIVQYNT